MNKTRNIHPKINTVTTCNKSHKNLMSVIPVKFKKIQGGSYPPCFISICLYRVKGFGDYGAYPLVGCPNSNQLVLLNTIYSIP